MKKTRVVYNERAWAIDLIGHIKQLASSSNRSVRDAGGEQTITAGEGRLFPDILLFGDKGTDRILQGWELKFPDTGIDDVAFRQNAEDKARALGLDSFLIWNVSYAKLYVLDASKDTFNPIKVWNDLEDIKTRETVANNQKRWKALAEQVLTYLNDLFDNGQLEGRRFIEAYRSGGITALIMQNAAQVAEAIVDSSNRDARLRSEIILWWERYGNEYSSETSEQALAQAILANWIGKILFGHILREKDKRARLVEDINDDTTSTEALELFRQLSETCNFWTIFSNSLGLSIIPDQVWSQLKEFNRLLSDLRVGSIDQAQLSDILETTVDLAIRKLRGQYTTPSELAQLLTHLCIRDIGNDRVLDPCCGSGTIARAAMERKLQAGTPLEQVASTIFASDRDPQAVQLTTFALARPDLMHIPLRVFEHDVFALQEQTEIQFRNPQNGSAFTETPGLFDAIISNLPFVSQDGRDQYREAIETVQVSILGAEDALTGRADIAAYIPFSLHSLLADGGRLGIVITNAWLGTEWGDAFYSLLSRFYDLKKVITSGAGRWFQNSKIVTNILVMEKKSSPGQLSGDIDFVVLTRPLEEMEDMGAIEIASAQIELGQTQNDTMTIRSVSPARLEQFRTYGLGGSAQFVDCEWILSLPLAPLTNFFAIYRGERRGMNPLFYPQGDHGIEAEYIKPLAKGPANFRNLIESANREAFSCSATEDELSALGHTGALNWIRRFKTEENIRKLQKPGLMWYEMKADTLAELVMFINYGQRLFVGQINPPAFVDQRLVALQANRELDIDLFHALLNSTISMFIIEGMGFGRGLGALDLSKNRIEKYLHVLDVNRLDQSKIDAIKKAFEPLLEREIMEVADELDQTDRQAFDDVIITAFGLNVDRQRIYDALLSLVAIRQTASQ